MCPTRCRSPSSRVALRYTSTGWRSLAKNISM
ncbi:MAG: hypothetical protein ISR41_01040 [Puniceicoccaceae bacterium]|nr:hypothetical protein [Puniceicoccaceae bacterium]